MGRMALLQLDVISVLCGSVLLFIVAGAEGRWPQLELDIWPQLARGASEQCRAHSRLALEGLDNLDIWAVQMHDATAKPGSGILNGNTNQFGDYDLCMMVKEEKLGLVGQYCMTSVFVNLRDSNSSKEQNKLAAIMDMAHSHYALQSKLDDAMIFPTFSLVSWGLCVPSSCSSSDVERAVIDTLQEYNRTFDIRVAVGEDWCEVYRPKNLFKGKTFITLCILLSILAFAVCGTFFEFSQINNSGHLQNRRFNFLEKLMLAFSFRKNTIELLDTTIKEDEISCVHGIRFIFCAFIYFLHRAFFSLFMPSANRTEMAKLLDSELTMIFRAFWNHVDVFVVLSGLLTSFYATGTLQSGRKMNIPVMYLRRYIKFTPIMMVAIFILRNTADEMRRGPQMIRFAKHFVKDCDNIWKSLFYISNFDGLQNMCYPPSHQLITDLQLYLTSPFLVLLLWHYRRRGAIYITGFLVVLTIYKAVTVFTHELDTALHYGMTMTQVVNTGNYLYLNPVQRITPYIIGILLGFYLRTTSVKNTQLSQLMLVVGWFLAGAAAYYSFFGPRTAYSRNYQYNVIDSTIYGSLQPLTWSLALSWVIFVCHTKQAVLLNRVLSWKGFVIFTRIAFAFYMLQFIVMGFNITSAHVPYYMHLFQVVDLNEITILLGVSVLVTLLFLLPLKGLYNIFAGEEITMESKKTNGGSANHCSKETLEREKED